MGDEGIGVHAVRLLEERFAEEGRPPGVAVVDGGTGGLHLLELLHDHDPVVLIDATMDGQPAGTVSFLEPRFPSEIPRTLTAHDIGLRDLVEAAALTGRLPRLLLVTVSITEILPMETALSPPVAASLPAVLDEVRSLLQALHPAKGASSGTP